MKNLCRVAVLLTLGLLAVNAVAQIRGVPASVTSVGTPTGNLVPGVPASVTSLGPFGWQVPPGVATPLIPAAMGHRPPFFNVNVGRNGLELGRTHHLHGHGNGGIAPVYVPYPVAYPVAYPVTPDMYQNGEEQPQEEQAQEPDPPAPTIFERRATTALQPDPRPQVAESSPVAEAALPEPPREQDPTVLIFKDGRQLEIRNFVIAGDMVIELSPEYHKIPLGDLDVDATVKENDARGLDFHVPGHKGS